MGEYQKSYKIAFDREKKRVCFDCRIMLYERGVRDYRPYCNVCNVDLKIKEKLKSHIFLTTHGKKIIDGITMVLEKNRKLSISDRLTLIAMPIQRRWRNERGRQSNITR
jgi:hypothetical protein